MREQAKSKVLGLFTAKGRKLEVEVVNKERVFVGGRPYYMTAAHNLKPLPGHKLKVSGRAENEWKLTEESAAALLAAAPLAVFEQQRAKAAWSEENKRKTAQVEEAAERQRLREKAAADAEAGRLVPEDFVNPYEVEDDEKESFWWLDAR